MANKSNVALGNGAGCPTCIYIRIDSRDDQSVSKMWPNQGALIDKTVNNILSIFRQNR